jgi:hypothetical protein
MFGIARYILRHKVGATAVVALAVVFMSPSKQDEAPRSNNPWATQSTATVAEEPGLIGGVVDGVVDTTVAYLDEHDLNPVERADETVDSFENTAAAMSDANARH